MPQLLTISLISTSPCPSAFLPLLFVPDNAENHHSGPLPEGELDRTIKWYPWGQLGKQATKHTDVPNIKVLIDNGKCPGKYKLRKTERVTGQWTDSLRQPKSTHCYSTHPNMLFPQTSHGFLVPLSSHSHIHMITPITCFIFKTT